MIDYTNIRGYTALNLAVLCNEPKLVELLLQYGANATIAEEDGCTPLKMTEHIEWGKT